DVEDHLAAIDDPTDDVRGVEALAAELAAEDLVLADHGPQLGDVFLLAGQRLRPADRDDVHEGVGADALNLGGGHAAQQSELVAAIAPLRLAARARLLGVATRLLGIAAGLLGIAVRILGVAVVLAVGIRITARILGVSVDL